MGTTRKFFTVTDKQDEWIKSQIEASVFIDDSDYVRDMIRCDLAHSAAIEDIRTELIKGEASEEPQPFDAARFKRDMTAEYVQETR